MLIVIRIFTGDISRHNCADMNFYTLDNPWNFSPTNTWKSVKDPELEAAAYVARLISEGEKNIRIERTSY